MLARPEPPDLRALLDPPGLLALPDPSVLEDRKAPLALRVLPGLMGLLGLPAP